MREIARMTTTIRQASRLLDVALAPFGATVELKEESADGEGRIATLLGDRTFLLGRGHDCDVRFDFNRHPRVSLRHAEITIAAAEVRLRDLDSRNGTFVNEARVHGESTLGDGDVVMLGRGGPSLRVGIYAPDG